MKLHTHEEMLNTVLVFANAFISATCVLNGRKVPT